MKSCNAYATSLNYTTWQPFWASGERVIIDNIQTFLRLSLQIGRHQAKRLTQEISLPHNGTTTLDRRRQPLMRVKRYRIGTFETGVEVRDVGVEDAERAIGPIHMQPETLLSAEIGQFVEWIHGTGIDRPGTAHHTKRS